MPTIGFERFLKQFASGGTATALTDAQCAAGWAYLGTSPPTVEEFNAMMQAFDDKDNWLYQNILYFSTTLGSAAPADGVFTALYQGVLALIQNTGTGSSLGTLAGTATVYTLTNVPALTAYANGLRFRATVNITNGVAPTLNIDAKGAIPIYGLGAVALAGGEMPVNSIANFEILISATVNGGNPVAVLRDAAGGPRQIAAAAAASHAVQLGQLTNTVSPLSLATAAATLPAQAAQMGQAGFQNLAVYINVAGTQQVSINGAAFTTVGATTFAAPISGRARYRVWGAGAGSGGTTGAGSVSQGGGAGAYAEGIATGLTAAIAITVGLGGTAGTAAPTNGGTGGTSSAGTLASCTGGVGGTAANGGIAAGVAGGGTASSTNSGGMLVPGGTSCGGFQTTSGFTNGAGGSSFGTPFTHFGTNNVATAGGVGFFPGGGASGSLLGAAGNVGGNGLVITEW